MQHDDDEILNQLEQQFKRDDLQDKMPNLGRGNFTIRIIGGIIGVTIFLVGVYFYGNWHQKELADRHEKVTNGAVSIMPKAESVVKSLGYEIDGSNCGLVESGTLSLNPSYWRCVVKTTSSELFTINCGNSSCVVDEIHRR